MITTSPFLNQPGTQALREVYVDVYDRDERPMTDLIVALHPVHPNLLIVGSDADVALAQIRPVLRAPLVSWSPRDTPRLPALSFRTLIVRDVESLTPIQQALLSALVTESVADIQVVSIARRPLFPLVREGRFIEALYYRLNVVLIERGRRDEPYSW